MGEGSRDGTRMILLTGGTGSLGNALIPRLLERGPVAVLSRDEYKQAYMREKYPEVAWYIGDIRDRERVQEVIDHVSLTMPYDDRLDIIHAAALKRVDTSTNPSEVIKTNVGGTQNILRWSDEYGARVLLISSDKAVYPINVYGMSKAIAEKLVLQKGGSVLRYGNVLWSRGSVLEYWEKTGKVTLSRPFMTRFWLTLPQAASLVCRTLDTMTPGSTHIPPLMSASIETLAEAAGYPEPYTYTGLRPGGEKMHETLEEGGRDSYNTEWYEVKQLREMIKEGRPVA